MNNRTLLLTTFATALILAGCASFASRSDRAPIATWVAEGVPEDTVVRYRVEYWRIMVPPDDQNQGITAVEKVITADGTVTVTWDTYKAAPIIERWQLSQDELKRLLLKFAEVDFFSLTTHGGPCVRYVSDPRYNWEMQFLDADSVTVSLTMRGMQNTIETVPSDSLSHCPNVYQRAVENVASLVAELESPRWPSEVPQPAPTATILPTPTSNQPMLTDVYPGTNSERATVVER